MPYTHVQWAADLAHRAGWTEHPRPPTRAGGHGRPLRVVWHARWMATLRTTGAVIGLTDDEVNRIELTDPYRDRRWEGRALDQLAMDLEARLSVAEEAVLQTLLDDTRKRKFAPWMAPLQEQIRARHPTHALLTRVIALVDQARSSGLPLEFVGD